MRLAFESAGGRCVYSNEWNKYSQQTYFANFGEQPEGDITKVDENDIPDHDVYTAILDGQSYVPQHRESIFIVGFDKERYGESLPLSFDINPKNPKPLMKDILEKSADDKYTLSDKLWLYLQNYAAKHKAAGNGFGYGIAERNGISRTLSARYYKDGSEILIEQKGKNPRRLTPRECARLQGFSDDFKVVVSDMRAYKQFGNSVAVPLMADVARLIVNRIRELDYESRSTST